MKNLQFKKNLKIKIPKLKEYKLPYSSFIGGWYIDKDITNKLIDFYNINKSQATVGTILKEGKSVLDKNEKDSLDLNFIINKVNPYPLNVYLEKLHKCLISYLRTYHQANAVEKFGVQYFNMQWYKPGGGFKKWHCERSNGKYGGQRHLVFMTYLNDVPKGGTEFLYQNLQIPAQKGLTLIWPTDWTHTHRGIISPDSEKFIITGWVNYI